MKDFNIEVEANNIKSRTATYIKSTINYKRRADLKGVNNGVTIIDMELTKSFRLINLYRSFNPRNGLSLRTLNNKINLNDLNDKMATFKIKMKSLFLNIR